MGYINHALSTYGFIATPLNLYQTDKDEAADIVNCFMSMLQARQVRPSDRDDDMLTLSA
jgi:hypothetical protein